MEIFKIQLDSNLWMDVEFEIIGGEEATYDHPGSPSTLEIQRVWIWQGSNVIDITECDWSFLEWNSKRIEEEIEKELENGRY
jgi:hypothetical protein